MSDITWVEAVGAVGGIIGAAGGIVGAVAGIGSAIFAGKEWRKINRKMAMIKDAGVASEVLPAWYMSRMMQDHWMFGLITIDGRMIAITSITSVSDNGEWMDVKLAGPGDAANLPDTYGPIVAAVADDRCRASVKIANIVAAIDLWTS